MQIKIEDSWRKILNEELDKKYFKDLISFVEEEYKTEVCYPRKKDVFAAFDQCSFESLKVVILGQDPYHGQGQANGLCFSVHEDITHPPSLVNIFKEVVKDLGVSYPLSGDLSRWSKQGVLLLNSILTVKGGSPGSHQNRGWELFTDAVISKISKHKEDVVFLLWGGYAKKKGIKIDKNKHVVLTSGHPSPLSSNRGYWFGNKHFSKTNEFLQAKAKSIIKW